MEYVYISAIIGLCLFNFWAYRRGLKDGLALNQGKDIEPIQNPVTTFVEYRDKQAEKKEVNKANDYMQEGINNVFSYTGDSQAKEGEK